MAFPEGLQALCPLRLRADLLSEKAESLQEWPGREARDIQTQPFIHWEKDRSGRARPSSRQHQAANLQPRPWPLTRATPPVRCRTISSHQGTFWDKMSLPTGQLKMPIGNPPVLQHVN